MAAIERLRAGAPGAGDLRDRAGGRARPDPAGDARRRQRVLPWTWRATRRRARWRNRSTARSAARRRAARRRQPAPGRRASTLVFFGAKGGAGTTTVAVNCARRARAADEAADGHRRPQAGPRRGRAVPRRAAALHACSTRSTTCTGSTGSSCRSWWSKHKSGPRDPRRVRAVRPARRAGRAARSRSCSACWRATYDYIVDRRRQPINSCAVAALYAADTIFLVANPDVPSVRNAQRLLDRVRQLGAGGERVQSCSIARPSST